MQNLNEVMAGLVEIINNQRLFCASVTNENLAIREWAREEKISLTRGMVRQAKFIATQGGLSDMSAINHKYWNQLA